MIKVDVVEIAAVNKSLNKVFSDYVKMYENGMMDFPEYAIIENILIKLQKELEFIEKKEVEVSDGG